MWTPGAAGHLKKKVYLFTVAAVLVATGLRLLLNPLLSDQIPFITFFPVLFLAGWYGGLGPALVCVALSASSAALLILPPVFSLRIDDTSGSYALGAFLVIGVGMAVLGESQYRAQLRARQEASARAAAEDGERRQRMHFEVTLRSIGEAVIATDQSGRVAFMNPVAERLTGYPAARAAGKPVSEVFRVLNEITGAPVASPVDRIMRDGQVAELGCQTLLVSASGSRTPIDDSCAPIRDATGAIVGAVLVFRDLTEIRRSERERLAILERIQDGCYVVDRQWRCTYANSRAVEQTGKPAQDLFGRTVWEVFPAGGPELEQACRAAAAGGSPGFFESYNAPLDRWYEGDIYPSAETVTLFVRDVTARKRAETAMAQLAAIVESSDDAIVGKDLNGIVQSWNKAAARIYGYPAAEMIGRPISLLQPPDRPDEEAELIGRIRRGERVQHFETVRTRKDGSRISVSLTLSPIRDSKGVVVGASHIARDITERKAIEERFREAAKLESLGVLAGGIAHDFNNLLVGIMGNISLALEDVPERSSAHGSMEQAMAATERAAHLTRQMLAYSGKGRFVVDLLDLSRLVRETLPLVEASIPRTVAVRLELAEHLPPVEADLAQFEQLLMNLVINAAEAIPEGRPGTVTIRTSYRAMDEAFLAGAVVGADLEPGDFVSLEVIDTGQGMDEDTRSRIFEPFFSTKFTGRGLGLAAALGIVRGHKGAIRVDTCSGKGSTFTVIFPPAPRGARSARPYDRQDLAELAGKGVVLVIDDEPVVRRTCQNALERYGYTVISADDGLQGVEAFQQHSRAVVAVILDMTMPVMSGAETFDRIKSVRADVPVILSSGYNEVDAVQRFERQGLAGFLQKPYTAATVAAKIKQLSGQ